MDLKDRMVRRSSRPQAAAAAAERMETIESESNVTDVELNRAEVKKTKKNKGDEFVLLQSRTALLLLY